MKRIWALLLLVVVGMSPVHVAQAESPGPELIAGTVALGSDVHSAIVTFLQDHAPAAAPYYAPTYVKDKTAYTLVSLAALDLQSPDEAWRMESTETELSNVLWTGSVRVYADGTVELKSPATSALRHLPKLARTMESLLPGPGGGPYVRLPFAPGKSMQFGVRGIHGFGDYGVYNMSAIDFVGGDSLGTNVAPGVVYASAAGEITYKCTGSTAVAVKTYNEATDDTFIYAHILDNSGLDVEDTFSAGQLVGSLKRGSYVDSCGWAAQADTNYHVHWMYEPCCGVVNVTYRVSIYTIREAPQKFVAAEKQYGIGDWIFNPVSQTGIDDPSNAGSSVPSFWDNVVAAIGSLAGGTANAMPDHPNIAVIINGITNTVVLMFRLTWLFMRDNFYLAPIAYMIITLIGLRLTLWAIYLIWWVIRTIRVIKQTANPGG